MKSDQTKPCYTEPKPEQIRVWATTLHAKPRSDFFHDSQAWVEVNSTHCKFPTIQPHYDDSSHCVSFILKETENKSIWKLQKYKTGSYWSISSIFRKCNANCRRHKRASLNSKPNMIINIQKLMRHLRLKEGRNSFMVKEK